MSELFEQAFKNLPPRQVYVPYPEFDINQLDFLIDNDIIPDFV